MVLTPQQKVPQVGAHQDKNSRTWERESGEVQAEARMSNFVDLPVPDLDFDVDLASIPVPDLAIDTDLQDALQDNEDGFQSCTTSPSTQFFRIADDDDDKQSVASGTRSRAGSFIPNKQPPMSARTESFVDWLTWRQPFLRFEGKSKGLAWEYPLSKNEKRELLLLVMVGAERDMEKGNHEAVSNAIYAAAPQPDTGAKLASIARRSRASFKKLPKRRPCGRLSWGGA